jgi:hypothetical protein
MTFPTRFLRFSLLVIVGFALTHCADPVAGHIENAQFLLDEGRYTEALVEAQKAVDADPDNVQANFLKASAMIGISILGEGETYLSFLANLMDEKEAGESDLQTFVRVAPSDTESLSVLEDARDLLIDLTSMAEGRQLQRVYLQLYMARLFEIAGATTRLGAVSPNEECNADPNNAMKDTIPDDFDPDALTDEEGTRYQDNMDNLESDSVNAGLGADFGLNDRIAEMKADMDAAIDAAGDAQEGLSDYFTDSFGDPTDVALCVEAK